MPAPTPRVRHCATHRIWGRGCPDCLAYDRWKRRRRSLALALGQPTAGNVPKVVNHVRDLIKAGMTIEEVARRAGMGWNSVNRIYTGEVKFLQAATERALMAVQSIGVATPEVLALGVARRLRALAAVGFSNKAIADAGPAELTEGSVSHWRRMRNTAGPRRWAWQMVAEVYEKLYAYTGTSQMSVNCARANGWHPPEAWDASTIDDPAAEPYSHLREEYVDEVLVKRALNREVPWADLNLAERCAMLRQWLETTGLQPNTFRETFKLDRQSEFGETLKKMGINRYGQPRRGREQDDD